MLSLPKHLGGHLNITHIDEATLVYLLEEFLINSMYDVGCGPGGMVALGKSKGLDAVGIDGDYTLTYPSDIQVIQHDFTKGPIDLDAKDLSWSCEFLEHVEEKYMDNYFSVFQKTRVVIVTYCNIPGTGHHHVNVQNQAYWDDKFKSYGFSKDQKRTDHIRLHSSMKRNFVRDTGTVYINERCS